MRPYGNQKDSLNLIRKCKNANRNKIVNKKCQFRPATGVGTQLVTSTASSSSASDDVTIISNGGSDHLSPATAVAATMTETFHTPLSSINVTPMKSEDIAAVAVGVPKVLLIDVNGNKSTTPNFELGHFSSPTADMFTSSPNNEDVFAMSPENRATFAKVSLV